MLGDPTISRKGAKAQSKCAACVIAVLLWLGFGPSLQAEVKLPRVLSDHMVLQRDRPIRIWGWADPDEKVTVTLGEGKQTAKAGKDRAWEVQLPAMKAGGPHVLTVAGTNTVTINDILIGEVWFCSGQSNMGYGVLKALNPDKEIAAANHPKIRFLTAPTLEAKEPASDIKSEWRVCHPKMIAYTSAVAYYYGRELHQKLDVPVGLIVSAVNGTRIEPWTPGVGVESVKELVGKDKTQDGDLYNGMIHPFTNYPIRGAIWYQGEGNVGDGMWYYHRMRALVGGWRKNWGQGDFPFYYVQLTPLNWGGKPVTMHPELWEAQTASLQIPNTGMAVTTDIVGHVGDAHPRNKQEVGRRLARWALAKTYGHKDLPYSGPLYQSMQVEGDKIRLSFDYADAGLRARDGKALTWFTICGADRQYVPAKAMIDGKTVLVWADAIMEPVAVRFGWHQIAEPNLMNAHGLPASPFRTEKK